MTQGEKQTLSSEELTDYMESFLRAGGVVSMTEYREIDTDMKAALIAASNRIKADDLMNVAKLVAEMLVGSNGNEQENAS